MFIFPFSKSCGSRNVALYRRVTGPLRESESELYVSPPKRKEKECLPPIFKGWSTTTFVLLGFYCVNEWMWLKKRAAQLFHILFKLAAASPPFLLKYPSKIEPIKKHTKGHFIHETACPWPIYCSSSTLIGGKGGAGPSSLSHYAWGSNGVNMWMQDEW
jgi:hypothetical protein